VNAVEQDSSGAKIEEHNEYGSLDLARSMLGGFAKAQYTRLLTKRSIRRALQSAILGIAR
jgi:hypothetical protein